MNLCEKQTEREEGEKIFREVFRTQSGRKMCQEMFLAERIRLPVADGGFLDIMEDTGPKDPYKKG